MDRVIGVGRPRQCGGDIIDPQCSELVRDTVPVFNMATAHDADDQRPPRIAPRAGDRFDHGAVPELLRTDETFEPFRSCAGVLACGRVLLKPLKQPVAIKRRGRCSGSGLPLVSGTNQGTISPMI